MIYLLFSLCVVAMVCMAFIIGVLLVALDRDRKERHALAARLVNALLATDAGDPGVYTQAQEIDARADADAAAFLVAEAQRDPRRAPRPRAVPTPPERPVERPPLGHAVDGS